MISIDARFRNMILTFIAIGTLTLVGCDQPSSETSHFDIEMAKGEIASRLSAYEGAMRSGDRVAFANLYTEDAVIFHNGSPSTVGRENIVKIFEGWIRDGVTGSYTTTGLWGNEDLLVEQGTGYFASALGSWKASGKYLLVWKKVDGEWEIFRDSWFADPED